jgi:hypothetical protein
VSGEEAVGAPPEDGGLLAFVDQDLAVRERENDRRWL